VNGLPVNTACGSNVMEMCQQMLEQTTVETITAMATGTIEYGMSLHKPMQVQLVPCCLHQKMLAGPADCYNYSEVFFNRTKSRSNGPHVETLQAASGGAQQFFLLRAVVLTGFSKHQVPGADAAALDHYKLAFIVKVFNTHQDIGFMPGLRLGVVYADALLRDKSTVVPYVQVHSAAKSPSQGANIVLAQPLKPAPPRGQAQGLLSQMPRVFKKAGPDSLGKAHAPLSSRLGATADSTPMSVSPRSRSPVPASSGHGLNMGMSPRPVDGAAPGLGRAASQDNVLVMWVEDTRRPPGPFQKKSKIAGIADILPRFQSSTCESLVPATVTNTFRQLTRDQFALQRVLGGILAVPLTGLVGHDLRKNRAEVWHALSAFWSSLAVQHLAGVLALALDGYGHGKMNLLVKLQYNGCCGRWDMMAVWAAKYLNLFPAKYVSAPHHLKDNIHWELLRAIP